MAYFPSLDKCLSGKEPLISWNAVLNELTSDPEASEQLEIQSFLSSNEAVQLLSRPSRLFDSPNEQTKRDFLDKTAPIHVSSADSGSYDIVQIKTNALWLAKEVDINEVSALRLVILEWQSRPSDLLLGKILDTESNKGKPGLSGVAKHRRFLQIYLQESSAIRHISALLVALDTNKAASTQAGHDPWMLRLGDRIREKRAGTSTTGLIHEHVKDFETLVSSLEDNRKWPECFQTDFAVHADFSTAVLRDLISNVRQSLTCLSSSPGMLGVDVVLSWFKLMQRTNFLQELTPPTVDQATLVELLQCLVSVFSAAILALPEAMVEIGRISEQRSGPITYPNLGDKPYITDDACLRQLNLIMFDAAESQSPVAGPALYAWSILTMLIRDLARMEQEVLQQIEDSTDSGWRHSSVTKRQSSIEQKLDVLQDASLDAAREDPPQHLARYAVDSLNVFAIIAELSRILSSAYSTSFEIPIAQTSRLVLFDIVREGLPAVNYDEHILEAVLALLAPDSTSLFATRDSSLATKFWNDQEQWFPAVFQEALSRYPYEISPLLRLLGALVGNVAHNARDDDPVVRTFQNLSTLTMTLPDGFRGYTLEHEEDGINAFRLLEGLPIFSSNITAQSFRSTDPSSNALQVMDEHSALKIPAGTHGTIRKDQRPFVVSVRHGYSGLSYIGLLLTTLLPVAQYNLSPPAPAVDNFVAADTVQLILRSLLGAADREHAELILREISACIPNGLDITAIIGEILESQLLARAEQAAQPGSSDLVVYCIRFFNILSRHFPERLWSYLAQGGFLGTTDGASALLTSAGSSEDAAQRYQLVRECSELYKTAVHDAVGGLVRRRGPSKSNGTRSGLASSRQTPGEVSERSITHTIAAFTSFALQVLNGICQGREIYSMEKSRIVGSIASTFVQLLICVYGTGDVAAIQSGPTKVLAPAALLIVSTLLPDDPSFQAVSSLLTTLVPVLHVDAKVLSAGQKTVLVAEARAVLSLVNVLLRTAKALSRPCAKLNSALISDMSILTALFARQAPFQKLVAEILTEMVSVTQDDDLSPESIFCQLSQQQGTNFLELLTRFDSSLTDTATETKVWELFAAACKHGQQWFAMYLVTAVLPKDQIKDKPSTKKTALSHALDLLSDMRNLNPERAAAILQFVAEAQKAWPWVSSIVREHADFLTNSLNWLRDLKPYTASHQQLLAAKEYQLAAALCDVLAINAHVCLEIGNKKLSQDIIERADFLARHAATVNGYSGTMLSKNLANTFPGVSLTDLKRTRVNPGAFGNDYMYDIETAKLILGHHSSWEGYSNELVRANVNWSLYLTQIELLNKWKILAITLAEGNDTDDKLTRLLTTTVQSCLAASASTKANEPEAATLLQTRADLVFALLSKLNKPPHDIQVISKTEKDGNTSSTILGAAWGLVLHCPYDYNTAQAGVDLTYYRTLLQILFLALQLSNKSQAATQVAEAQGEAALVSYAYERTLTDIMTKTVAPSFKALCGNLHESVDSALPEDFALLIALAQAVLSGGSSRDFETQISDAVAFSTAIRSAASLFSWSDRLAELTNGDPVYGELAIMFLLTLSRVRQVAEQMAVEGILSQISSANLSNYLRKPGGKGPFDEPSRVFAIWTNGFLPLCLNLIEAVGPPIASEISSFFSSFPQQLARAELALQNASPSPRNPKAGAVTLGLVTEARDLVTIAQILQAAAELGAADGIVAEDVQPLEYNLKLVGDDLEAMTKSQRSLRDRITPVTAREYALHNDKSNAGYENALQGAIVRVMAETSALLKE